jgi:5-(carboxyamino)imidazole ribonucleotide synthase
MRVGIIGAGQLGQMLGFAARDLDIECCFLDPSSSPPAAVCGEVIQRPFDDDAALDALAGSCDIITYEFENVPVDALRRIQEIVPVYPPVDALQQAQDRLFEKQLFDSLAIPLPAYHAIASAEDCAAAADTLGLPMVVKTRRFGYDGKGQFVVRNADDISAAWLELGAQALIAEEWVAFDREVSAIGVRNAAGDIRNYELTQNVHRDGILRTSRTPVDAPQLQEKASAYMCMLLERLEYVGVLALELFVRGDQLLANEFAPRVHNSGHWSIEGAATSQFENHLRAVAGLPLGPTTSLGHAGMVNLIGEIPESVRKLCIGYLHDYGKTPRADRKLGHVTVVAETATRRDELLEAVAETVN